MYWRGLAGSVWARKTFQRALRRVLRIPAWLRSVAVNLAFGLAVMATLSMMGASGWVQRAENAGSDWVFARYRGVAPTRPAVAVPQVLLEIDEASYREWGEPLFTPRDKLAALIDYARSNGAHTVVVDIALERDAGAADAALRAALAKFADKDSNTQLVLVRSARWPDDEAQTIPDLRESPFDALIDANPGRVHLASAAIEVARDGQTRRFRMWEPVCKSGVASALPSVALTVAALREGRLDALREEAATAAPPDCQSRARSTPLWWPLRADAAVNLGMPGTGRRIFYVIPWKLNAGEARPEIDSPAGKTALLTRIPARRILNQPDIREDFRGHVVIIGTSHPDARDNYFTPLGEMPGPLVLANAIHTVTQYGELRAPALWLTTLVQSVFIVIMSLAFLRWNSMLGAVIVFVVIALGMVPLSLWLLRTGMWLDFVLPLLAVQTYQTVKTTQGRLKETAQAARSKRRLGRRNE